jgi:small subunit ribosomal protein S6
MAGYKPEGALMNAQKSIYETVFVLHPELSEEDAEAQIQNVLKLLEGKAAEVIRIERGGKRRLAYIIHKQRYGYYTLIHFRATSEVPAELERTYRLNERVIRYLTVHYEKEEHLTGFARMPEDDGREEDRDDRRRGGRRTDSFHFRGGSRYAARDDVSDLDADADTDDADEGRSSRYGETFEETMR